MTERERTERETCGFACVCTCMCLCVPNVFACEGSTARKETCGRARVEATHASFRLCHAKTYGRSDIEDTVSELWGYSNSMQFI